MKACPPHEKLSQLLAEELPPPERSDLETHIEHCPHCQQELERLTKDSVVKAQTAAGSDFGATPLPQGEDQRQTPSHDSGPTQAERIGTPTTDDDLLAVLSPSAEPGVLGRLGHYEILELVGKGGMGLVLKAKDTKLRRIVAIKLMAPQLAVSAGARQRFIREAQAAAAVRTEHVVNIFAVADDAPIPYLAMEFITGLTLEQCIEQGGPLAVRDILRIGKETALGLAAAHAQGLIHRDIKPGNILLEKKPEVRSQKPEGSASVPSDDGPLASDYVRVKITDFGLARAADDASLTQSGVIAGTPLYMSPEQARGDPLDSRTDLFSLGGVLYTMCTGQAAFRAANSMAVLKRVCDDAPRRIHELNPNVPGWLAAIVLKLLAKHPSDRLQSAAEVAELLDQHLIGLAQATGVYVPAAGLGPICERQTPHARRVRRWLVAGLLLAAAGVAAWLGLPQASRLLGLSADDSVLEIAGFDPAQVGELSPTYTNGIGMEFVLVQAGTFRMGGTDGTVGRKEVQIRYPFYIGKYEVTQEEWQKVMKANPSAFCRTGAHSQQVADIPDSILNRFPVEMVSWFDCQSFIQSLNAQVNEARWVYRLPMEAEWEYACRGGPRQDQSEYGFNFYFDRPTNELPANHANVSDTGLFRTVAVGSYPPNQLAIHEMHGNVFEWCESSIPTASSEHVSPHRGGCFEFGPAAARAGASDGVGGMQKHNSLGLRIVRVPSGR